VCNFFGWVKLGVKCNVFVIYEFAGSSKKWKKMDELKCGV
jgi:hypothetical protein